MVGVFDSSSSFGRVCALEFANPSSVCTWAHLKACWVRALWIDSTNGGCRVGGFAFCELEWIIDAVVGLLRFHVFHPHTYIYTRVHIVYIGGVLLLSFYITFTFTFHWFCWDDAQGVTLPSFDAFKYFHLLLEFFISFFVINHRMKRG